MKSKVFKARALAAGWVAWCPCQVPPIRRRRWRDAFDALHDHLKEVHL